MNKVSFDKITDRKIRVALVGAGRISSKHFDAIDKHKDNLELVAICDNNEETLKKITKEKSIEGFLNLPEMLDRSNADAVILTTPSGLHPDQTIQVARAGKHVISEKPMATRWEDGKKMVEECDQNGVRLFIVKQNRHNATLQLLKKAIEDKRFGRIFMVNVNVFWTRPQDYYDQAKWRGTWEFDGGAFMNQASHYIDLLDWLVGPIESLQSYTATLDRNIEVEDTGVASIRWRSGALGSLNVTMLTYPQNFEGSLTILGEKGTVRIGGVAVNEIQKWEFEEPADYDKQVKEANYETTSVYGFGHPAYYENVIETLRGETEPLTCGREGLKSLEILIGLYRSARDGKRVSLPLDY